MNIIACENAVRATSQLKASVFEILNKEEKQQIIDALKVHSPNEVAKLFNVSLRNITRWKTQGTDRRKGSGRNNQFVIGRSLRKRSVENRTQDDKG